MSDKRGTKYARSGEIVYRHESANAEFWDARWADSVESSFGRVPGCGPLEQVVMKYLEPPSRVLEGGCGLAEHGRALAAAGYDVTGLDYAPRTISILRERAPDIHPTEGDVRDLPFLDCAFDGYLSPGVIEHFYEGWDAIGREAYRVLRPGGLLFLTFPAMSPLRRLLLRAGRYPRWRESLRGDFYQFALRVDGVQERLASLGFVVEASRFAMGLSGIEDAFPRLESAVDALRHSSRPIRAIAGALSRAIEPWGGHIAILVARRP